jgi:sodium/hydrogen antiporter
LFNLPIPDSYDIILLYVGTIILISTILPRFLKGYLITAPIIYLLFAVITFSFVDFSFPKIVEEPYLGKRLTEFGVIISLTAAGLKLKYPFSWATWKYTVRLLIITMPLTIAGVAFLGWWALGFAPATALLLGAAIAPTDPVLASDVQTTPPHKHDTSIARLTLTTEAGLNDGLAFPFTNMAIALALMGTNLGIWFTDWFLIDVIYKIAVGAVIGFILGWVLAKIIFMCPRATSHHSFITIGIMALSLTFIPYGIAEILKSYGFIAVFIAACTFRYQESHNEHLTILHDFSEAMEKIIVAVLFTLIGIYLATDFVHSFELYMIPAGLFIVLIIRPLSGMLGFVGSKLPFNQRMVISFYGIRGIGSIYYILYALYKADFQQSHQAMSLLVVVIISSLFIHGLSAKPIFEKYAQ